MKTMVFTCEDSYLGDQCRDENGKWVTIEEYETKHEFLEVLKNHAVELERPRQWAWMGIGFVIFVGIILLSNLV